MNQRESLAVSKPEKEFGINGKRVIQFCLAQYFLLNQNTYMPLIFLDLIEIQRILKIAYEYAVKIDKEPLGADILQLMGMDNGKLILESEICDSYEPEQVMSNYIFETMEAILGCLLTFESNQSLLIVGSANQYYMIDVPNGIFTTSSAPEYDVVDYVQIHGSIVSVEYLKYEQEIEEVEEKPEPEPKPKKKRITIKEKDA